MLKKTNKQTNKQKWELAVAHPRGGWSSTLSRSNLKLKKKKQTKKPTPKTNKQTYRRVAIFIALASNLPKRTSYFVDSMMIDVSIATVYS